MEVCCLEKDAAKRHQYARHPDCLLPEINKKIQIGLRGDLEKCYGTVGGLAGMIGVVNSNYLGRLQMEVGRK